MPVTESNLSLRAPARIPGVRRGCSVCHDRQPSCTEHAVRRGLVTADASWSRDVDDAFWHLVRDRPLPHARLASREPASTGRVRLTLPAGWFGLTSSLDYRRRGT